MILLKKGSVNNLYSHELRRSKANRKKTLLKLTTALHHDGVKH